MRCTLGGCGKSSEANAESSDARLNSVVAHERELDHAQGLLGDLVYVELPNVGDHVQVGNACAVVESVKAASDVYTPVSGTVVEVNAALADKPETINEDAYGDGWLFVVELDDADQLGELLAPDDYAELLDSDEH